MKIFSYKNGVKSVGAAHVSVHALKKAGVEVYGRQGIYIQRGATIESGAKIYAPCYISADCHISGGASVMPYCYLQASFVGANAIVRASTLIGAHIGAGATVGPYSYLRGGAYIGENCRIGGFVEVKSSAVGNDTKIAHLAYVGDAEVGCNVNIGCGVVFANYDGKEKHKTKVGDCCFIGCNCNIVAPVTLQNGAYIAAGTTVTQDVGEDGFCIGRIRENIKPHGAAGRYKGG
ncbi:MAG: UDP-N-acetylglucosamine diphosphorylase [Clostridia bacterium]|nr:UDP-N-acetylglucosamine diphosphorylase [Clostridia bacterium]